MMAATKGSTTQTENDNAERGMLGSLGSSAQDAVGVVRTTAERAAARLPEVAANAQVAARDTQRTLETMPSQALVVGTSFSLGLAAGLFIGGANRLLVGLALAPAGAMAMTILGRESDTPSAVTAATRRTAADS
jgi:hypothetical protein